MHLDDYVAQVQRQLTEAAALGDDQVQRTAAALASAATPAVRLAIMAALAEAADEITALLLDVPTSPAISVRLDGDTVRTEMTAGTPDAEPRVDDGDPTARISLRLSEGLKADIESAATRDGVSVNTWLVRAANAALISPRMPWHHPHNPTGHRLTGFVNG